MGPANGRAKACFASLAEHAVAATAYKVPTRGNRTAPLFGSADLNVDFKADRRNVLAGTGTDWFPYTVLGQVADVLTPNDHGPTHGGRLIDQAWLRQAR